MNFADDILNVYAYLLSKSKETADQSRAAIEKIDALDASFQELNDQADTLLTDMDALLAEAYALAEKMNVDTSGISGKTNNDEETLPEPISADVSARIQIPLPVNFDYRQEFQRLVQEAHAAGFTDAHPDELLTPEEMAHAEAISDQLDEEFRIATQLQSKDLVVLTIAVAARVLCYFLTRKIRALRNQKDSPEAAEAQALPVPQVSLSAPDDAQIPSALNRAEVPSPLPISAAQGVDIAGMLSNVSSHGDAVQTGQQIVAAVSQKFGSPARILDHNTILEQNAPFDIQETDLFQRDDIVAYHKFLGWIVGTVNILTDTITTYGMKSYSVSRPTPGLGKPCVDQEISTLLSVVSPVLRSGGFYKESIAAAAVQEALTQGFGKASPEQVRSLFSRTMELENKATAYAEETKGLLGNFKADWAACIGGIAVTTLINTIVSAVHAILYEESDGSLDTYAIRTNRIVLYSGAIATTINSLPAIASKNIAELDYSGILTTCMSFFQSTRFWIEAKTNFLVSAYRQELEKELEKLDSYFQYQI